MRDTLTWLFSIRAGEEKKTFLLYLLHLLFYLGLMWGEFTSETLFLLMWGADNLAWIFIGNAFLAFALALVYTLFVDRFSNARVLLVIVVGMIAWLLSVRVLFETHGGAFGAVYPYFYLAYGALRDLSTLHILNYINDFYDTRAAKSALPLMLSAGIVGSTLAGLSAPLLSQTIGLPNVTLIWAACLVLTLVVMWFIRRQLRVELRQIRQARLSANTPQGTFANLRTGWVFVRESSVLRWLAVATFAMVVLMRLLNFQSSQVFLAHFQNNAAGLFNFYGLLSGIGSALGLTIQALFLSRLVSRLGVGVANLLFPSITFISIVALDFVPNLFSATFARLDFTLIKQTLRNPVDAMLFNAVPVHIKGRAKAFVNALIVPLGTLVAGVLLLSIQLGRLPFEVIIGGGILISAIYVAAAWRVRTEYGRALAQLLARDEMALAQLSQDEFAQSDPATLNFLMRRLHESTNDDQTLFLAEILYEMQGRESFAALNDLAAQRSARVRAGIIQMLGAAWIGDTLVRRLCWQGTIDADATVRLAAASALVAAPASAKQQWWLDLLDGLLDDANDAVRATVMPALIAYGNPDQITSVQKLLATWLSVEANSHQRTLGLSVLARTDVAFSIVTLQNYLRDPSELVRRGAAEAIHQIVRRTPTEAIKQTALGCYQFLLADASESVRLAAIQGLGCLNNLSASRVLLGVLNDRSLTIRRQASLAMGNAIPPELDAAGAPYLQRECAAFILASANRPHARQRVLDTIRSLVSDAYALHLRCDVFAESTTPGMRLLRARFQEEIDAIIERVFWLISALDDEVRAQAIRRTLPSVDSLTRANAVEALEAITSPQLAHLIAPLFELVAPSVRAQIARATWGLEMPTARQIFAQTWQPIANAGVEVRTPNLVLFDQLDLVTATTIYSQIENRTAPTPLECDTLRAALHATLNDARAFVRETAQAALACLDTSGVTEEMMLTAIGKVVFLKEVPFFHSMPTDQLRILAGISEEVSFEEGQKIIEEGAPGDALYIVISGQVAIQKQARRRGMLTRLATLGPKDYFGETSVFDTEPRSADAVALQTTQLLLVRQAPFVALVQQHPDLALGLLKVFSQRLRQANAALAEKTPAKPKELMDLYDKL